MKIKQLKTQEERKTTTLNKNQPEGNSSKSKNPLTEPEKTQGISDVKKASEAFHDVLDAIENAESDSLFNGKLNIEDAKVIEKTPAEKMEEILKNNDKFETVKVIMDLLCKELELPKSAPMDEIVKGLYQVTENYFKSMHEWKKMTEKPVNNDIRQ